MAKADDEGGDLAGTVGVVSICSSMMLLGTLAMVSQTSPFQPTRAVMPL
jgi:hypothetical protein